MVRGSNCILWGEGWRGGGVLGVVLIICMKWPPGIFSFKFGNFGESVDSGKSTKSGDSYKIINWAILVIMITLVFFVNLVILRNQLNTAFLVISKKYYDFGGSLDSLNLATLVNQVIVVNLMFLICLMNDRIGMMLRMCKKSIYLAFRIHWFNAPPPLLNIAMHC